MEETMKRLLITLALLGGVTTPAFAQQESETMTCSDFTALGRDEQIGAIKTAQVGESVDQATAAAPDPDQETAADTVIAECTAHPDRILGEVIKSVMGG
jgi:HdeA/HdeB family